MRTRTCSSDRARSAYSNSSAVGSGCLLSGPRQALLSPARSMARRDRVLPAATTAVIGRSGRSARAHRRPAAATSWAYPCPHTSGRRLKAKFHAVVVGNCSRPPRPRGLQTARAGFAGPTARGRAGASPRPSARPSSRSARSRNVGAAGRPAGRGGPSTSGTVRPRRPRRVGGVRAGRSYRHVVVGWLVRRRAARPPPLHHRPGITAVATRALVGAGQGGIRWIEAARRRCHPVEGSATGTSDRSRRHPPGTSGRRGNSLFWRCAPRPSGPGWPSSRAAVRPGPRSEPER